LITHGHLSINGQAVNIPSYSLKPGDVITVREGRADIGPFKEAAGTLSGNGIQEWLRVDATKLTGTVVAAPRRDQMPGDFNEQLVVEFYSR
jgi:small subunit ribosomal protein S4